MRHLLCIMLLISVLASCVDGSRAKNYRVKMLNTNTITTVWMNDGFKALDTVLVGYDRDRDNKMIKAKAVILEEVK